MSKQPSLSPWELNLQIDNEGQVKKIDRSGEEDPFNPTIPPLLPHEAMFKIQVGSKLFDVSGASLSSDGPSFFTECFSKQNPKQRGQQSGESSHDEGENSESRSPTTSWPTHAGNKVLFIDRSADIFELIYKHLQGYYIDIEDEVQYTMLYADAMYYNLPRLRRILREYDYYFANIGGKTFRIAKSLLSRNGDSPNYFSMTSSAIYVDIEQFFVNKRVLRPPPQSAPYVSRSPAFFTTILELLGGAEADPDDNRRETLIKECRYYRFLNLEQRLIKCKIMFNPITNSEDILLSLRDINRNKLEFPVDKVVQCNAATNENSRENTANRPEDSESEGSNGCALSSESEPALKKLKASSNGPSEKVVCWKICSYKRPYLDESARDLIFQIDSMESTLIFNRKNKTIHVALMNKMAQQFEKVFGTVLSNVGVNLAKLKITLPASDNNQERVSYLVLPACISICDFTINGDSCSNIASIVSGSCGKEQVLDFTNMPQVSYCPGKRLHLSKSLWRLGANNGRVMMIALKVNGFSGTKEYSKSLQFL